MSHRGISHIGLSTLNLDKTREFYEGVLVPYELTRDNTCEESCGRGGGGVEPWAC
jgi:hypothetical protein